MNKTHVCLARTAYYHAIYFTIIQNHYRQNKNIPISQQSEDYVQAQLNIPHSYLQKISEFANNGRFVGRLKIQGVVDQEASMTRRSGPHRISTTHFLCTSAPGPAPLQMHIIFRLEPLFTWSLLLIAGGQFEIRNDYCQRENELFVNVILYSNSFSNSQKIF